MRINAIKQDPINNNNTAIEDVQNFTYLGSIVSTTGGTDEDITARKKKAQQAFSILKPVWRSRSLRTCTKIRFFNSIVKSVLLYGSETWRETVASSKCIQTFVNKCLRKILNIRLPNTISNKELWRRTQPISQTIRTRKWRWVGHTLRKKRHKYHKTGTRMEPPGTSKTGKTKEHLAQRTSHRTKNNWQDLERDQKKKKNSKRQKEVERNRSRPMSPFGRSGLIQILIKKYLFEDGILEYDADFMFSKMCIRIFSMVLNSKSTNWCIVWDCSV